MKNNYKKRIVYLVMCIILSLVIVLSLIYIIKFFLIKKEAVKERNLLNTIEISEEIIERAIQVKEKEQTEEEKEKARRILQVQELQKENDDIVGWIEIENTNISYPVVQGEDNDYYLTHNSQKEKAEQGAIFLDSNYNWNLESNNLMIYGHYMNNGEMFTDLLKYADEEFYKEHPIIRFTTAEEDTEYDIISTFRSKVYYKSEKNVFKYYNFMNAKTEKEYNDFIENIKKLSLYDIDETAEYGDRLITLSTCTYYTEDGRFVVVGRERSNL